MYLLKTMFLIVDSLRNEVQRTRWPSGQKSAWAERSYWSRDLTSYASLARVIHLSSDSRITTTPPDRVALHDALGNVSLSLGPSSSYRINEDKVKEL